MELLGSGVAAVAIVAVIIWLCSLGRRSVDEASGAVRSRWAVSRDHDGHRWVETIQGGLAHHPDCQCLRKAEEGPR